jgi:hypothetical protein
MYFDDFLYCNEAKKGRKLQQTNRTSIVFNTFELTQ